MTIPRHLAPSVFCLSGAGQLLPVAAAEEADLPAACILKRAGTPQAQEQEESSMGRSYGLENTVAFAFIRAI
jgi:hypothetical protein